LKIIYELVIRDPVICDIARVAHIPVTLAASVDGMVIEKLLFAKVAAGLETETRAGEVCAESPCMIASVAAVHVIAMIPETWPGGSFRELLLRFSDGLVYGPVSHSPWLR
jgi:hypothetical protein